MSHCLVENLHFEAAPPPPPNLLLLGVSTVLYSTCVLAARKHGGPRQKLGACALQHNQPLNMSTPNYVPCSRCPITPL